MDHRRLRRLVTHRRQDLGGWGRILRLLQLLLGTQIQPPPRTKPSSDYQLSDPSGSDELDSEIQSKHASSYHFQRKDSRVLQKIGNVSYELLLPEDCKLHHTFHISQLKKYIGPTAIPNAKLPLLNPDGTYRNRSNCWKEN